MRPEDLNLYVVFEPDFYNIQGLPQSFKQKVEDKYARFYEEYVSRLSNRAQQHVKAQFNQILSHMNKEDGFQPDKATYNNHTFYTYNKTLDDLRKEDLREVFPELQELFIETEADTERLNMVLPDVNAVNAQKEQSE